MLQPQYMKEIWKEVRNELPYMRSVSHRIGLVSRTSAAEVPTGKTTDGYIGASTLT